MTMVIVLKKLLEWVLEPGKLSYGHKHELCRVTCIGRIGGVFNFGIGVYHSVY